MNTQSPSYNDRIKIWFSEDNGVFGLGTLWGVFVCVSVCVFVRTRACVRVRVKQLSDLTTSDLYFQTPAGLI